MMKKTLLLVFLSFLGIQVLLAQTKTITGTVVSAEDGQPLPGVSVVIKGTTNGASTDIEGKYTISATPTDVLLFTFVGMEIQEILVGKKTKIDIKLKSKDLKINEVIVTAYGTTKKSSFTGAATAVKSEELLKTSSSDVVQSLQGKIAGVQVVSSTGKTGESASIRIRGVGSYGANSEPLYVVDGISGAPLPNSEDIESMTILKDASASSLYGSRAANGVVIVTTKQGKKGETRFTVQYKKGLSDLTTGKFEKLDAGEFYRKSWEGLYNKAKYIDGKDAAASAQYAHDEVKGAVGFNPYNIDQPYDNNGNLVSGAKLMYDRDWQDALFRTGKLDVVDFSASGGSDKINYYFSASYYNEKGISVEDDYKRYTAKINVSSQVNKRLKIGVNSTMKHSESKDLSTSASENNNFYNANTFSNITPLYELDENFKPKKDAQGNYIYNYRNKIANDYNPIGLHELNDRGTKSNYLFFSPYIDLEIIKDLVLKSKFAVRYGNGSDFYYNNPYHGAGPSDGGNSYKQSWESQRISTSNYITYNKEIEDHNINILLGQEYEEYEYHDLYGLGTGYPLDKASTELAIAQKPASVYSSTLEDAMISYFSRINYDYLDKYYISLSFRRDGSSKFGPDHRWGNFWSIGGSWRIKQESFLQDIEILDDLKIRASYGISGTDAISRYRFDDLYTLGANYNDNTGLVHTQLPNPKLNWEENASTNIGIDVSLLNKYTITFEYYKKETSDLLMDKPITPTTGFTSKTENIGELLNEGFEFTLDALLLNIDDFRITSMFNFSYNNNEWTKLPQDQIIDGSKRYVVGKSRYNFYLREWAGVEKDTGKPMWYMDKKDENGKAVKTTTTDISKATYYDMGSATPDFFMNFTTNFSYKQFDLSLQFYGAFGGLIYDDMLAATMHDGSEPGRQLNKDVLNSWSESNKNTNVPRYIYNNSDNGERMSSRYLFDSDFIRLKAVNLSYNLHSNIAKKIGVKNLKLYFLGENLLTFTDFEGYDPEAPLSGRVGYNLPNLKKYTFGVKFEF